MAGHAVYGWEIIDSSLAALITSVAALIAAVAAWRRAGKNGQRLRRR